MKTLKYIFSLTTLFVLFISCSDNDTKFYNVQYVNTSGLVTIQTQPSYAVNDILYVNGNFSRFVNETNQVNPLDIFKTTGGAAKFNFSYILEKKLNATTWNIVDYTNSQLDINDGQATAASYIYGSSLYNTTTQYYEFQVGVPLLSAGDYRLSFVNNGENGNINTVELRSESKGTNMFLNINSTVSNLDSNGYYLFTVN